MFAPKPIPQNPLPTYPPPPAQPPTDVTRTPVPEGAPPPGQAPDPPDRVAQVKARIEPRKEKARAALKDQRAVVRARLKAWFAAADLTDDDLAKLVLGRKQKAHRDKTNQLSGEVTRLRRKLSDARVRAAQERISTGATQAGGPMGQFAPREASPDVVHLDSEVEFALLNLAEHRKTFADILPASPQEISRARQGKKAARPLFVAAGVIVGGMAWVSMLVAHPVMTLIATPFGLWIGWRWLARPIEAREQEAKPALSMVKQEAPASGEAPPPFGVPLAGETASPAGGWVVMNVEQLPDGAKPFPLADAHTPERVAQCVLLALIAEGVPAVEVSDVVRQPWGWQCIVRVGEGTPEAIIKVIGDLETRLDLATNGVRPQPMIERRACTILRLVNRGANPFATAPGLPYRAPKSMSITDRFRIGTSVGGDPLELSLAGVMGLWVAASGGGKTGILQALAEGTTACYDNITIDLDPHGDGLEDLGDCVRITARTNEQIEAVLLFFLVMSKARARLRAKLGMGKKWKASAAHPAVMLFFDEFPKASELAKRLAFDLLLVGRKELIEMAIASQGGTRLYLGENFAQMVAMKGVGPCKVGDTRAVLGDGSVNEGWLPHKLSPATDTDPKDAGHIYIQGVPGRSDEPIEYAVHETHPATLRKLAEERLEAGLVEPDMDSLEAMRGVDLPEYVEATYDNEGNIKKEAPVELLTWDQLLRLCGAEPAAGQDLTDGPARAAVGDAVAVMEESGVDRMKTEVLLLALRDYDRATYGEMAVDELKALLKDAGAGAPITIGQVGDEANPRGFKRDRLRHLL